MIAENQQENQQSDTKLKLIEQQTKLNKLIKDLKESQPKNLNQSESSKQITPYDLIKSTFNKYPSFSQSNANYLQTLNTMYYTQEGNIKYREIENGRNNESKDAKTLKLTSQILEIFLANKKNELK